MVPHIAMISGRFHQWIMTAFPTPIRTRKPEDRVMHQNRLDFHNMENIPQI
jgi:hypothetical protein